jgi:S-methylmethionine-dependent homocysteine/selenocysteine methylase
MKSENNSPAPMGTDLFMTDGGIETTLIFQEGLDLPYFAAFHLLSSVEGNDHLRKYYRTYMELAQTHRVGLIFESPTWRSGREWGALMGYTEQSLSGINKSAILLMSELSAEFEKSGLPSIISGCVGPRGDGYKPGEMMSVDDAHRYHHNQILDFKTAGAGQVTAITMNYLNEATGIALAAQSLQIPVVISFTVETDGHLPTGQHLKDAIETLDMLTDSYPAYYMINCAHPTHFKNMLNEPGHWLTRIKGIRANASTKSHAELDESTELDPGDPLTLAHDYHDLKQRLPGLNVLGGCCGTDHRHIDAIFTLLATQ